MLEKFNLIPSCTSIKKVNQLKTKTSIKKTQKEFIDQKKFKIIYVKIKNKIFLYLLLSRCCTPAIKHHHHQPRHPPRQDHHLMHHLHLILYRQHKKEKKPTTRSRSRRSLKHNRYTAPILPSCILNYESHQNGSGVIRNGEITR